MTEEELKKVAEHCREVMDFQRKNRHVRAHTGGTCPNCGYCPHCGRSNAQPIRPNPYRYRTYPYWYIYPPYWSAADCGITPETPFISGTSVTGVKE